MLLIARVVYLLNVRFFLVSLPVKKEGQSGIISSIAFSPENLGLYALGSYSKSGIIGSLFSTCIHTFIVSP